VTFMLALMLWSMPQALSAAASPAPGSLDLFERMACAPIGLPAPPAAGLRVLGGNVHGRIMFGPGDATIINAGTTQGVQRGQQYFVRRLVNDASQKQPKTGAIYGVHTAGWVTIVDAKDDMAVATVAHACDGILEGDFLEPFAMPQPPPVSLTGAPDFEHPGQIVLADEGRQTGYPGLVMLMNRGSDHAVRAGQLLTVYRETLKGQGPIVDLGRATVLAVTPQSSMVRIDSSRDVIYLGDFVAIHRITQ
jgi:hypothetical protein